MIQCHFCTHLVADREEAGLAGVLFDFGNNDPDLGVPTDAYVCLSCCATRHINTCTRCWGLWEHSKLNHNALCPACIRTSRHAS